MERPVIIGNVHNMSLESLSDESDEYPHLVAQFSCETDVHNCMHLFTYGNYNGLCCAAVWLNDMHNIYHCEKNQYNSTDVKCLWYHFNECVRHCCSAEHYMLLN